MKGWYSRSRNIKLRNGREVKEWHLVFDTTDAKIKWEIERYFQEIMDRPKKEVNI